MATSAHERGDFSTWLYTVTYLEVAPGQEPVARSTLARFCKPGAVGSIETLQRLGRSNQLAILASAPQAAAEGEGHPLDFAQLDEALAPLLIAPTDTRQHFLLARGILSGGASSELPASPSGGAALVVVTHVDVVPQYRDDGSAALQALAAGSAYHAGCLRFDVWQQTNRPNHFTVVEGWEDSAAFRAHIGAVETRRFRAALGPMSGALYDERLYQTIAD